jgi:peptide/nickel transport system ATP-binding protein
LSVLTVLGLTVSFAELVAVDDVSFEIQPGQRLGLVGESGAGKSLTALAISGLLPRGARTSGNVLFSQVDLANMSESDLARIRGRQIGTIFQDPLTSLNPVKRVGEQVAEMFRLHQGASRRAAATAAVAALANVGLPDPSRKARSYPHQLSGGQRQRVMIAIAMACRPQLLIADEPTTALDVTIQAEILALLNEIVAEQNGALLFISHDLPVVSSVCDTVCVMYGGRIVEGGPTNEVFASPRHPYTAGLLAAQPGEVGDASRPDRLPVIPGVVPPLGQFPSGCGFRDRCSRATTACETVPDRTGESDHHVRCWNQLTPS